MSAKYVLRKTADHQFMFNLKAGNGEVILTSERYTQKANAENGIESVRKNSSLDGAFERMGSGGTPYFVLKAANKEIVGTSEMYSSPTAMEGGITSVKQNAAAAVVEDETQP